MPISLDTDTLRKLQLLELKCLKELKRICEANNIPYFLIGGTLIGAVRHKGFIPWDDDIDIGMLRSDYDRFCKICAEQINKEAFTFQIPESGSACADYEIARIRLNGTHFVQRYRKNLNINDGIFIEIIPYDDLPPTKLKSIFYYKYFRYMKRLIGYRFGYRYYGYSKYKGVIYYILANLLRIIPLQFLHDKMINYHKKYSTGSSQYVFLLGGAYNWDKERHLRTTVSEYTELEFEGEMYPVPKNYDLFLREQYGDYMTPPPPEEQIIKSVVESIDFGPYIN